MHSFFSKPISDHAILFRTTLLRFYENVRDNKSYVPSCLFSLAFLLILAKRIIVKRMICPFFMHSSRKCRNTILGRNSIHLTPYFSLELYGAIFVEKDILGDNFRLSVMFAQISNFSRRVTAANGLKTLTT